MEIGFTDEGTNRATELALWPSDPLPLVPPPPPPTSSRELMGSSPIYSFVRSLLAFRRGIPSRGCPELFAWFWFLIVLFVLLLSSQNIKAWARFYFSLSSSSVWCNLSPCMHRRSPFGPGWRVSFAPPLSCDIIWSELQPLVACPGRLFVIGVNR